MFYDVKALFTSMPIQPAMDVIKKRLEEDGEVQKRTSMSVQHIISLLEFCLRSTYFTFQDRLYEQQEGAAMGSPISPIVANLFMEDFEKRAIESSPHPPCFWRRFVDDTFTIIYTAYKESFLEHLNSIDDHIQFTSENPRPDVPRPFWISWSLQIKMEVWAQQFIGIPLTQISTFSGTATTQCQQSIVWLGHYTIEQKPYARALSCYNKKKNIFKRHSIDANTLHGILTELRSNKEAQPKKKK